MLQWSSVPASHIAQSARQDARLMPEQPFIEFVRANAARQLTDLLESTCLPSMRWL